MTDLHTHILPGMDDGAQTSEEAVALLQAQQAQGVDTVALTPHFYGREESVDEFLSRRKGSWRKLQKATDGIACPQMILGAEVAWLPEMTGWDNLEKLCYENTRMMLVELPFMTWTDEIYHWLYNLESRCGIMPMIAHLDRYMRLQGDRNIVRLLDMGYPVQVSAETLFRHWPRKGVLDLLITYDGILISDCHNMTNRRPHMGDAITMLSKKLDRRLAGRIASVTDEILLD